MMIVRTAESPPYNLTSKMLISIINRRSLFQVRRAGTSYYVLHKFHCETNGGVPILLMHTLHFQIPTIYLRQWHQHCSNAKSHPSTIHDPSLTMLHPPGHWCFPTSLVETTLFHNQKPVVIKTFPNTKWLLLR
jgi:hypothetical protein